jgi:hypothetical protein
LHWREARGGPGLNVSAQVLGGLLLLAGAAVSAALPKGHRWLFVIGIVGSAGAGIGIWIATGYEDFEGPPWLATLFLAALYGGLWSIGVIVGFLGRLALDALLERRTWR